MRVLRIAVALLTLPLVPMIAQDSASISITAPDSVIVADTTVVAVGATDSVSTLPVTVPTPAEPGVKAWLQATINEYGGQLLVLLASLASLMFARWFPAYARFGTAMKALATFAGAMAIYSLMRWIGGTVPDDVMRIVLDGLGPVIASVLAAFGVGNMAKQTKVISAAARD